MDPKAGTYSMQTRRDYLISSEYALRHCKQCDDGLLSQSIAKLIY